MARRRRKARESDGQPNEEARYRLRVHLEMMGFTAADEYRAWCREHGLGDALSKPEHRRTRELRIRRDEITAAADARWRLVHGDPSRLIDKIFAGETVPAELTPDYRTMHELLPTLGHRVESRDAFRALLIRVLRGTKLFSSQRVIVEARGKRNAYPTARIMSLLRRWAEQEGLIVPSYLAREG